MTEFIVENRSHILESLPISISQYSLSSASSDRTMYFNKKWRFNPSVRRAKGEMLVRARVLPVCDL